MLGVTKSTANVPGYVSHVELNILRLYVIGISTDFKAVAIV